MHQASEILIGLDAGADRIEAVAFDRDGAELQAVATASPVVPLADGPEQDLGDSWQAAAQVLRQLASLVPDLARRTVALAITGQSGGTWLIDEDGDQVAPAWPGPTRRARSIVQKWQEAGLAGGLQAITGGPADAARANAQLACLLRDRPEVLERAATAFGAKDWLYFCCTGERATDVAEAVAGFGNRRTRAYDPAVLQLLGLEEVERLLPEIVDGAQHHGILTRPAAAATGLSSGIAVVLAPPNLLASALAAGLAGHSSELAGSILGATSWHLRVLSDRDEASGALAPPVWLQPFPLPATSLALNPGPGSANADWLLDLGVQLLADAGLIGIGRHELRAMLERKAAAGRPGVLLAQPFATDHGPLEAPAAPARAHMLGLGPETTIYDLLRALHEAEGFAARSAHAALGPPPAEIRLLGAAASSPLRRAILAACSGCPVRTVERAAPGAAGAALFAAVALGFFPNFADSADAWVEPWLGEPERVDPELYARYAQLYPIWCGARSATAGIARALDGSAPRDAQMALAPLSIGKIAPVTLRASSEAR
jgi:erythritol kinase